MEPIGYSLTAKSFVTCSHTENYESSSNSHIIFFNNLNPGGTK